MMYEDVIADFAQRTASNLKAIQELRASGASPQVFEVTQLVNSMLGLLVFPQQRYMDRIPQTPIEELQHEGWPIPTIVGNYRQVSDLRQLVRVLRNAVAHYNLEFEPSQKNEIKRLILWNTRPGSREVTWKASLSVSDLESITQKFVELLLNRNTNR